MKHRFLILFSAFLLFAVVSCDKFKAENFAKIEINQTEEQVVKQIGPPTSISTGSFLGFAGTIYKYEKGNRTATLVFGNGKLLYKEGQL